MFKGIKKFTAAALLCSFFQFCSVSAFILGAELDIITQRKRIYYVILKDARKQLAQSFGESLSIGR